MLCNDFDVPSSDPPCGPQKTLIINHHDEINHRLFHLRNTDNFNMVQAELEMLGYTSLCREVFKDLEASGCARASLERAARLQTLLHFISCQGVFNKDGLCISFHTEVPLIKTVCAFHFMPRCLQ